MTPAQIKSIIIDDEPKSIQTIKAMLAQLDPNIETVATAGTVAEGVQIINQYKPDLVFLDIYLLDGTGFEIIEQTDFSNYEVIFITAYHQHAIRAFEVAAIHYLLKPIRPEQLEEAIERFREHKYDLEFEDRMRIYQQNINSNNTKIILPLSDGLSIINLEDVIRCESSNNYTTFFMKDKKQYIVSRPINFYEQLLKDMNFIRIHSKHLINLKYVEKYVKGRGGCVVLEGNVEVDVSPGKKKDFLDRLNEFARGY